MADLIIQVGGARGQQGEQGSLTAADQAILTNAVADAQSARDQAQALANSATAVGAQVTSGIGAVAADRAVIQELYDLFTQPHDWSTILPFWNSGRNFLTYFSPVQTDIVRGSTTGGNFVRMDNQQVLKFAEGDSSVPAGLNAFDTFLLADYEAGNLIIRSTDPTACRYMTLAEAVLTLGVSEIATGDYDIPLSLVPGFTGAVSAYWEGDTPSGTTTRILSLSDGTSAQRMHVSSRGTSAADPTMQSIGGSGTTTVNGSAGQLTANHKGFAIFADNDLELVMNGASLGTSTTHTIASGLTSLKNRRRFDGAASNQNTNAVRKIALIPSRVSQADAIAATA